MGFLDERDNLVAQPAPERIRNLIRDIIQPGVAKRWMAAKFLDGVMKGLRDTIENCIVPCRMVDIFATRLGDEIGLHDKPQRCQIKGRTQQ